MFFAIKIGSALINAETSFGRGPPRIHPRRSAAYWMLLALYLFMILISGRLVIDWACHPKKFAPGDAR
ncbi:hypothetical protein [Sphingomonas sp.]|uniref:hypothetical protein n=1 Tax=Sphingomonas sp. TaxID=28214 RepID=UPI0035BBDB0C